MNRKFFGLLILGTFLVGCKVKHSVTHVEKKIERTPVKPQIVKITENSDGLYPMPEDTGKFIPFKISNVDDYIATFSEVAIREMKAFGIPASITLAQGLLESGFGRGELAMKTNNHFGIKCHKGWQGDYDFYDDDEKGECFRKYNHPMYSYRDHSLFLTSRSRYASLFKFESTDYKKWANGLKKAGYATDKKYPQKLISLIERYNLSKFDAKISLKQDILALNNTTEKEREKPFSPKKQSIHIVKQGETLYAIAKAYSITVDDLKRFNYMYDNVISVGQELKVPIQKFN